ncbi:MAG: hypothetical protein AAF916_12145 [Planctomycetota bacterium]
MPALLATSAGAAGAVFGWIVCVAVIVPIAFVFATVALVLTVRAHQHDQRTKQPPDYPPEP